MSSLITKTSAEWMKEIQYSSYEILDPDGWNRNNFDYSFRHERINREEFERRLWASTVQQKTKP